MKISVEFFPPRDKKSVQELKSVRQKLTQISPDYFSVTFGAGGNTKSHTLKTILDIKSQDKVVAVPHISCMGMNRKNLTKLLHIYKQNKIKKLIVLRGDIPSGMTNSGDFHYAYELVSFIRKVFDNLFHIEVAAYPEKHPQSETITQDIQHFIEKVKVGADGAITQYFYNADAFYYFRDEVAKHGLTIPITPGIMPITNYTQLVRFSKFAHTEIPKWILTRLDAYQNNTSSLRDFGYEVVHRLCDNLKIHGVDALHFYSMNHAEPTYTIAKNLNQKTVKNKQSQHK